MAELQVDAQRRGGILALGSMVLEGQLHAKLSLGCQDACYLMQSDTANIGVVCDGCSSTERNLSQNQVGAIFGAEFLANALARNLRVSADDPAAGFGIALKKSEEEMLAFFRLVRDKMVLDEAAQREFVLGKLIFSIVGFVVMNERFWIFGLGDGCYGMGTEFVIIDKSPVPYLNHRVLKRRFRGRKKPSLLIYAEGQLGSVDHLWVATDGLAPLLRNNESKVLLPGFLADEDACGRDGDGIDTTKQAFRRAFHRRFQSFLGDDVALALLRRKMPGSANGIQQKGTI